MSKKHYSLHLPVYKQGDDFHLALELANNNPINGFLNLAQHYIAAAEVCQKVAECLKKAKTFRSIDTGGDTHFIWLSAPEKLVKSLVEEEILTEDCFDE